MKESWTVRKILEWTKGYLRKGGVERARFEAEILLAYSLGLGRLDLYLNPDRVLSEEEQALFRELLKKRREGVPLQYLTGEVQFMDCSLKVTNDVLIPRFETEELIERIVDDVDKEGELSILDLGTGSGAIAIALAKLLEDARVKAVDISAAALKVAQENAERNGVIDRIEFAYSDWFENVAGRFDLIVSNPPYINPEELNSLPKEVKDHEPPIAWNGGEEGVEELKKIIVEAPLHLKGGGRLYLEIGEDQAARVKGIILSTKAFNEVKVFKDLIGKERVISAVSP